MEALSAVIAAIPDGRYVAAISGGVDSMVLLDLLGKHAALVVVVAHFDHGIRQDSALDYELVRAAASRYGLEFYGARVRLGEAASEATAREVRYGFLQSVRDRTGAKGIITAHHEDDLVETMAIQLMRGTYRRGLAPMAGKNIVRPLLGVRKPVLYDYARSRSLDWREDSTNDNPAYVRNRLRLGPLSYQDEEKYTVRQKLLQLYREMLVRNEAIDAELAAMDSWMAGPDGIIRAQFIMLPHAVARDYLAHFLRSRSVEFDSGLLDRLTVALKVQKPHSRVSLGVGRFVEISQKTAQLLVQ